MPSTTISDHEFILDPRGAKKAADLGPVFIIDDGIPAYVLLSIKDYEQLVEQRPKITELLAMPQLEKEAFDPAKATLQTRPADLT